MCGRPLGGPVMPVVIVVRVFERWFLETRKLRDASDDTPVVRAHNCKSECRARLEEVKPVMIVFVHVYVLSTIVEAI